MRVLDVVERIAYAALAVAAAVVVLDALLTFLEARERNPIVRSVDRAADVAAPDALGTVFVDQSHWVTALLVLVTYALVAWAVRLAADAVRWLLAARTRRRGEDTRP